jgi:hypothetical protein
MNSKAKAIKSARMKKSWADNVSPWNESQNVVFMLLTISL